MRRLFVAASMVAMLASCAPRPTPPAPVPQPQRQPTPRPEPSPPPSSDWTVAPLSAGDWSYRGEGAASSAVFGPPGSPSFAVRCEASRQISLARIGASTGSAITVRTTYGARSLPAGRQQSALVASLPVSDPLLDQMAFSRGRFAIEAAGAPLLIVPAWPELARVIEDCRG